MPSRPSKATATKLWTLSGNECANPDCINKVFEIDDHSGEMIKFGQIAHINAAKPGGNRYDPSQTDEERHSFKNLMVLCPSEGRGHGRKGSSLAFCCEYNSRQYARLDPYVLFLAHRSGSHQAVFILRGGAKVLCGVESYSPFRRFGQKTPSTRSCGQAHAPTIKLMHF